MEQFNGWGDVLSTIGHLVEKYNKHSSNKVLTDDEKCQVSQDLIDLGDEIQEGVD